MPTMFDTSYQRSCLDTDDYDDGADEVEAFEPVYFGEQICANCGNLEMVETSVKPTGAHIVAECNYCWTQKELENEFIRPEANF